MDSFVCNKTGRTFNSRRGLLNHLLFVYPNETAEQIYLQENNIIAPVCKYCDNICEFISFHEGYHIRCSSSECKHKYKADTVRHNNKKIAAGISGYDQIILNNKELYISAFLGNSIIDPLDGMIHKTTRFITHRSETSLKGAVFYEDKVCEICGETFSCNFIRQSEKKCCSNRCELLRNLQSAYYTRNHRQIDSTNFEHNDQVIDFDVLKSMTIEEFSEFCSQRIIPYIPADIKQDKIKKIIWNSFKRNGEHYFDPINKIHCNILTNKHGFRFNNTLRMLINNGFIKLSDYINIFTPCEECGVIYEHNFTYRVDENYNFVLSDKSQYNYCSVACYNVFKQSGKMSTRYIRSEESRDKQSTFLKNAILTGAFTPKNTNSWCKSRIYYDGMNFRSTWEFMYYFTIKDMYTDFGFEKVRIPYFDPVKNKNRVYIVDFFLDNHTLVEVKPESKLSDSTTIAKLDALYKYAEDNNYKVLICGDDYFRNNLNASLFESMIDSVSDDKLKLRLSKYAREFL